MQASQAKVMNSEQRKNIALKIITNNSTVTQISKQYKISRKFINQQTSKAIGAIDIKFASTDSEPPLLYVPVTKAWINQTVLTLMLTCKASYRNVKTCLETLLNYNISVGSIFTIAQNAIEVAKKINVQQDLSNIAEPAIDELFHLNIPLLTGVDLRSTYCFLLQEESTRDGETWAKHLAILKQQGLDPEKFIADFGSGLREGIFTVYKDVPFQGDVFHVLYYLKKMVFYFKNRIKSRKSYLQELEEKFDKSSTNLTNNKNIIKARELNKKIMLAEEEIDKFELLAANTSTLVSWMAHDVLSVAGPNKETRLKLYDFILEELKKLQQLHPHRITAVYTLLNNNKQEILAFVNDLEQDFLELVQKFNVPIEDIWELCELCRCQRFSEKYYQRSKDIRKKLGENQYILLLGLVGQVVASTNRASSMVENLNGRIKPYCEIRKQIGRGFTELLRFFINHTPLSCSRKKHRKNKTPAEVLMQKEHLPWLEMLGFQKPELCKFPI